MNYWKDYMNNNGYKYIIGIDPGKHTGLAMYETGISKITYTDTTDFWGLIDFIDERNSIYPISDTIYIIEDPGLNKPIFYSRYGNKTTRAYTRIAQNVGMNKEEAKLIIEYMERNRIHHKVIQPVTRKWTEKELKQYTGFNEKVSQHVRDAIKLIHQIIL